jgi:DNA-binding GntR family transcriptional regulator
MHKAHNRYSLAARTLLSHIERLNGEPASYDLLAAQLGYDRDTIRVCVRRLEQARRVVTITGRGGKANRYLPVSQVVTL